MVMNNFYIIIILVFIYASFSIFITSNGEIDRRKPTILIQNRIENFKNRKGRITNGYIAETGSNFLPFYALLYVQKNTNAYSMCAGSIISEKFIISAGHCFEICFNVYILAGFNSSQIDSFTFFDQVPPTRVIMHPAYNPKTIANDIALIQLQKNIIYNLVLQRILLPSAQSIFINKVGIISGFGTYSDVNPVTSNVLRYTFVTVINGTICLISYGATYFSSESQLCIDTSGGQSTCLGDSGGPLGIFENKKLLLAGIVSYGSDKGCELGYPEVYTKVSSYLIWIKNITGILI